MRIRLYTSIVCLLLISSMVMAGPTGKISGRIIDKNTGEPLIGVNIILMGTNLGAASFKDGQYFILNVPPGIYTVKAQIIGYTPVNKTDVRVSLDRTTTLNFELEVAVLLGETVTIVAERPVVEKGLTASKAVITAVQIEQSWVNSVDEVVEIQSGVNIHGGIRGGFGLDVAYLIDGQDVRDMGSNTTFLKVNTSAVQEVQVLTGGWNAEYGKASGAIINVVTKSARDQWHGSLKARVRPAGVYHWGRNFYSKDNFEWQVIDSEYFDRNSGGEVWNDYWETVGGFTPDPDFNWQKYQEMITPDPVMAGYADRAQTELQGTVYGPITSKINLMASGQYVRGVPNYPSALEYNPSWNGMMKLDYQMTDKTKLNVSGMIQRSESSGVPELAYISSQDQRLNYGRSAYNMVTDPFSWRKFFPFGGDQLHNFRPPEYIRSWLGRARLTHVFSPRTYLEFSINHSQMEYRSNYRDVLRWTAADIIAMKSDPYYAEPVWFDNKPHSIAPQQWQGDIVLYDADSRNTEIKVDLLSQINPSHQLKTGIYFAPQYIKRIFHMGFTNLNTANHDDWGDTAYNPYEGGAYIQDKIEVKGMTVNLGVRFDFFNANKMVNYTVFDPAAMSEETDGNLGIGIISFDPEGEYAVKTKTQYAISPRIGIAHQITEGTVLHFMYGHFNQRPVWTQITQNAVIFNRPRDPEVEYPNITPFPDDIKWCYMGWLGKTGNPALEYQRMIQYEVGVDQNIADFLRLDATLYYKDGVNLTNVGWQQGAENYETAHRLEVMLYSDPNHPTKPVKGKQVGFTTFPINGGYLDVRGLELTLETIFMRHVNISAIYNISYSSSGRYGPYQIYKEHINDDGSTYKLGIDNYWTGEESIGEIWNPVHTLKVNAHFDTPVDFGPQLGFFRPLGDWIFNVYYQYASPQKFTYHSVQQGDFSTEPRNMSWKAHHKVNLRVAKGFMIGGIRAEIFADVYNLFNSKVLRLMSGDDLVRYMEYGELPTVNVSYQIEPGVTGQWSEVNEWGNYTMDLMPRQIFFGLGLTF